MRKLVKAKFFLPVFGLLVFLLAGCSSISYVNIRQDIAVEPDLTGTVSQTFTLNENNYSLLSNQYSGDVLKGHAQDLAKALGWSKYDVKTWNDGSNYFIKLTSQFANPHELTQLLSQSGQQLDLRTTEGLFSKKFGFDSTARISQLKADTLTVSLTLPGSVAFSNGKTKDRSTIEWSLSQDSRLTAVSASLVEYDAFVQLNFNSDESGKLILGVVAPKANVENAGKFYGENDPARSVGEYVAKQAGLQDMVISSKNIDKNTWVYAAKDFTDATELSEFTKHLEIFKTLEFQRNDDNFQLGFALKAELFPYPKGLGNPNHLSFSAHMPGSVSYSNGTLAGQDMLVWEVSDSKPLTVNATSSGRNVPAIRRIATLGLGGFSLVLGLIGVLIIFFSRKTQRTMIRLAGIGGVSVAVLGGIALAGTLIFVSEAASSSITFLPTPGPGIAHTFNSSVSSANSNTTNTTTTDNGKLCSDGYYDPSGQCWSNLDSANGSYDSSNLDNSGFSDVQATPEAFGNTNSSVSTVDPNDYDGDGVGNLFDNDPNYYNPPSDFDYGQQDPLPFQDQQP